MVTDAAPRLRQSSARNSFGTKTVFANGNQIYQLPRGGPQWRSLPLKYRIVEEIGRERQIQVTCRQGGCRYIKRTSAAADQNLAVGARRTDGDLRSAPTY